MLPFWLAAAQLALAAPPTLTLADALARVRPTSEQAVVAADLAAARRLLAETSHGLADGPTLAVSAGPRHADGATRPDVGADVDWPLLAGAARRPDLAAALAQAATTLPAAAAGEQRLRAALAYVEAWSRQELAALRRQDLASVECWQAITARRAEAGAMAGFEIDLAQVEIEQARGSLALTESEALRARGELDQLVELPGERMALAEPALAEPALAEPEWATAEGSLAQRAIAARRQLAEASLALEEARAQSRLALRSSVAREGEETVARVGLGYRFPRRDERSAAAQALAARREALAREESVATADLARRVEAARVLAARLRPESPPLDLHRAFEALELRLAEGKAGPAESLTLRRTLLAAQESRIERQAARLAALHELRALTAPTLEEQP